MSTPPTPSMMAPRARPRVVAVVYTSLPQYRVPFFERLRPALAERGVEFRLVHGDPPEREARKQDAGAVAWAQRVRNRSIAIGRRQVFWQPALPLLDDVDLVIVEQASKLLLNYVLLARQALGGPKVALWGHGRNLKPDAASALGEAVKRFASRRAHWFFAYNDMGARVVAEIGFPRERTTIVQNAIDTRALRCRLAVTSADELAGLRTSLGLRGSNVAIYAGAMYADKRLDFLVAAAEEARRLLPDFELLMIGSGPDAHVARAAAERHPWIKYLGPTFGDGKVPLFMLSKAMLLPGVVGLAVLDAFALETPLVTVALPSHGPEIDYLEPGVNGVMLRQGATAAEYAGEVVRLLEDDAGREQLREGCRRAAARYTMEAMVERFADGVIAALDQDGAP